MHGFPLSSEKKEKTTAADKLKKKKKKRCLMPNNIHLQCSWAAGSENGWKEKYSAQITFLDLLQK